MRSQTVVTFMIAMASALAYVHRTEAKAIAVVCRTDTRTDVGAISPDGQMPQTLGRLLERNPGWDLLRTKGEHLRTTAEWRADAGG